MEGMEYLNGSNMYLGILDMKSPQDRLSEQKEASKKSQSKQKLAISAFTISSRYPELSVSIKTYFSEIELPKVTD